MTSNGTRERVVSGLAERGYTLGEILSTNLGASGSAVFRGEYEGKPVALKLASYGFLNSFAGENVEKLENFRRREVETLRLAGSHPSIPNYIESFDIDIENQDPVYVLAMEYLDCPSIADRIARGERISDEEAKIFFRDGLSAEDHLHTGLPTQTLHRDVKTKNALFDGSKAYLIDFDIVKQGDGSSTRATQIEPNGYYPADFYGGTDDSHRPEHDVVALGNVAIAGIAGKEIGLIRYGQGGYGLEPVDTSNLNVSPEVRKYLAKMTAPPNQRFQTAREALEGLERILGSSVPIVKPEPETQEQPSTEVAEVGEDGENLPSKYSITNHGHGAWTFRMPKPSRGNDTASILRQFDEGKDVHETIKNLRDKIANQFGYSQSVLPEGSKMPDYLEAESQLTRVCLQYLAQENPTNSALSELASGKNPEQLYEEVKAGKPSRLQHGTNLFFRHPDLARFEYKQARKEYDEKVGQLEEIASGVKGALGGIFDRYPYGLFVGFWVGGGLGIATAAYLFGNPGGIYDLLVPAGGIFGAVAGSNFQRYLERRKLLEKITEMDSWNLTPESPKKLEDRVGEGDVGDKLIEGGGEE